jgi:hypothetical protein
VKHLHIAIGGPLHGEELEPEQAKEAGYETIELHYTRRESEPHETGAYVYSFEGFQMFADSTVAHALLTHLTK